MDFKKNFNMNKLLFIFISAIIFAITHEIIFTPKKLFKNNKKNIVLNVSIIIIIILLFLFIISRNKILFFQDKPDRVKRIFINIAIFIVLLFLYDFVKFILINITPYNK